MSVLGALSQAVVGLGAMADSVNGSFMCVALVALVAVVLVVYEDFLNVV